MAFEYHDKAVGSEGVYTGSVGSEIRICSSDGSLYHIGTKITSTAEEMNLLDGCTATTTELSILHGVTATYQELNKMDGCTATTTELNLLDGCTSTTAELNILDGATVTAAELNELDLSAVGAVTKWKKINVTFAAGTGENDTGWDLPAIGSAIILGVFVNVNTAEATGATKTVDIGTLSTDSGDADGFLDGVDVSSTGLVKGTLASGGQTLGAYLRVDESGGGVLVPEPSVAYGSVSVTWTPGSADFAELDMDILINYVEIA